MVKNCRAKHLWKFPHLIWFP